MFPDASSMSYATSKRRQILGDIYNYEMNYYFISSSTFTDSLQKVFTASTIVAVIVGCPAFEVSVEFVQKQRTFARLVPLWGQLGGVHDTLHVPSKKKCRDVKSGDRAGHATRAHNF
jgi:hypothetical protein